MPLRIIVDVFSGRPNPVIELDGKEAQDVLIRLVPTGAMRPEERRKEPGPLLGYRGLIVQQKGSINKKFPKVFRVHDGMLFGPGDPRPISDPTFEAELLGSKGPIARQKTARGFRWDSLLEFRGPEAGTPAAKG